MKSWFSIHNKAAEPYAEISIFDEIGLFGVTAKEFADALKAVEPNRKIVVGINSPGGSVFDGLAICSLLNARRDYVTCRVYGIAASVSSAIAMSGGRTEMAKQSMIMIHKASGVAIGDDDETRAYADLLKKISGQLAGIYSRKSGVSEPDVMAMMDAETWLTADEALAKKFCDEVIGQTPIKNNFDLRRFKNAPTGMAGAGGEPAIKPQNKGTSMNKIIAALVGAGIPVPADATEEVLAVEFNKLAATAKNSATEVVTLKTENQSLKEAAEAARKARIEAHVQAKVDAKIIGAELKDKWVASILKDESAQALLDAMKAPEAKTTEQPRRGAPPAAKDATSQGRTAEQELDEVREEMKTEKDPMKVAALARRARELRGHKDLLAAPAAK